MPFRAFGDSNVLVGVGVVLRARSLNALPGIRGFQREMPGLSISHPGSVLMPFRAFGDSNTIKALGIREGKLSLNALPGIRGFQLEETTMRIMRDNLMS